MDLRPEAQQTERPKPRLRRRNQKEYYLMKINKIVGSIEEQVIKNKLKRKCFDTYIRNARLEYCEGQGKDEVELIIDEMETQIIKRNQSSCHSVKKKRVGFC